MRIENAICVPAGPDRYSENFCAAGAGHSATAAMSAGELETRTSAADLEAGYLYKDRVASA